MLALRWEGAPYFDTRLPFGLCSAPKIFTAIANCLEWIIRQQDVKRVEHYLDDYIRLGQPQDASCHRDLETFMSTCQELGVPLAEHKQEGPCTRLTFLSIEINNVAGYLRLPTKKLRLSEGTASPMERLESAYLERAGISCGGIHQHPTN